MIKLDQVKEGIAVYTNGHIKEHLKIKRYQ